MPSAPTVPSPPLANGAQGACDTCGSAASEIATNERITNTPVPVEKRPTGRAPPRLSAVAVQIIAAEIIPRATGPSAGTKYAR